MCFEDLVRVGEVINKICHQNIILQTHLKYESLLKDSKTLQDPEFLFELVCMYHIVNQATTDRT